MKQTVLALFSCLLVAASGFAMHAVAAEENVQKQDPARWHTEDTTPRARFNNMTKEVNAAYQQALNDCRSLRNRELTSCRREAKSNYTNDMQRARRMLR